MSTPIGGGTALTLATSGYLANLAVDPTGVYWTAQPGDGSAGGILAHVPLGGGAEATLAASQSGFGGLAVGSGNVYWGISNGSTSMGYGGEVLSMPVSGSTPTVFGGEAEGEIAMSSTSLFWKGTYDAWMGDTFIANEELLTKPLAGGVQVTLASGPHLTTEFGPIVADDSSVYYSAFLINVAPIGIIKLPLSGGTPTTINSAIGQNLPPLVLALDDTSLYWANDQGAVMRLTPK